MKSKLTALTVALAGLSAAALPSVAAAQASPSAYTSATRYDALGRVTGTIAPDPDGGGALKYLATRTTYDTRGNVTKVETGELQSWKSEAIAPANWGADFDNHIHTRTESTYDTLNRKLSDRVIGSDNVTVSLTQYSYDAVGRLECTAVRMNPATYGSLPASACTLGTAGADGPDRITKTVYDAAGQVLQVRKAVGTPIEIADSTYSYTLNGKLEQVVDANGTRAELRYDGHDRQTRWVFPSKTRPSSFNNATPATALSSAGALNNSDYEAYTYDANGNRLSFRKRDGSTITYQYDNLNRMTRKIVPNRADLSWIHERDVYYSYDLRGLQTRARFDSLLGAGVLYTHDGFGRLTGERQTSFSSALTVSSQYDANGNRTRITHPDGQYFNYQYDGLNRLTNVTLSSGFGFAGHYYNARGLQSHLAAGSWSIYSYDPVGRLNQVQEDMGGTSSDVTWGFTRNPASQITSESQTNDIYSWNGHVNLSRSYTTNGLNQYTGAGGASFTYDANGNLTSDGTSIYLYDVENRLVNVSSGGYNTTLYYDPLGRLYRTWSSKPGYGDTRYLYDGNALVAEYNGSGTMLRRYVHGDNLEADDPLAWFEGSAVGSANARFSKTDPRGSVVSWVNWSGASLVTNSYDEYGIPDTASGNDIATKGRFRYTGQAWLPEIGMYYYKARIYSPTLGRFLQTDPIGYEDQYNLYAYVGNDPINKVDPTGLDGCHLNGCGRGEGGRVGPQNPEPSALNDALGAFIEGVAEFFIGDAVEAIQNPAPETIAVGVALTAAKPLKIVDKVADTIGGAKNASQGVKLQKQLASDAQMSQIKAGKGTVISQPAKQAGRLASQNGGNARDIQKVSSDSFKAKDGQKIETHAFRNERTGEVMEPKTIVRD